jgi:hypothetical protein
VSQINFYATRKDLLDLLDDFESRREVRYAEAGMFDRDDVFVYWTAMEIPNLGAIDAPNPHQGRILLVGGADVQFSMRAVPQRRGGMKFALDQKENPDTVSLLPGGQFDDQTVVAGNFATCTDSAASLALLGLLSQIAKEKWKEIKSYLVGPQAEAVLDAGGRLTAGLRPEYDLHR